MQQSYHPGQVTPLADDAASLRKLGSFKVGLSTRHLIKAGQRVMNTYQKYFPSWNLAWLCLK